MSSITNDYEDLKVRLASKMDCVFHAGLQGGDPIQLKELSYIYAKNLSIYKDDGKMNIYYFRFNTPDYYEYLLVGLQVEKKTLKTIIKKNIKERIRILDIIYNNPSPNMQRHSTLDDVEDSITNRNNKFCISVYNYKDDETRLSNLMNMAKEGGYKVRQKIFGEVEYITFESKKELTKII